MNFLAQLALALLSNGGGGGEQRPQGPGLNKGEAAVRKRHNLPTSAKMTRYSTSSGSGSGSKAVARAKAASTPKKAQKAATRSKDRPVGFSYRHNLGLPVSGKQNAKPQSLQHGMESVASGLSGPNWRDDIPEGPSPLDRMIGAIANDFTGKGSFVNSLGGTNPYEATSDKLGMTDDLGYPHQNLGKRFSRSFIDEPGWG